MKGWRTLRLAFFGVLAADHWTQIAHAARFGAGDFNVSHLPALDPWLPLPSATAMVALRVAGVVLAAAVALGLQVRAGILALAMIQVATTLWSQLDSYQHHWLLVLMLGNLAAGAALDGEPKAWNLRLLTAQVAVLYLWAAIAKMDPWWLDGAPILAQAEGALPLPAPALAWGGLLLELALAAAWVEPRLRPWALLPGLAFHATVETMDLEIGLFSWFMGAVYALALPQAWLERLDAGLDRLEALRWRAPAAAALALALPALLFFATPTARDFFRYQGGDLRSRGDLEGAARAYERVVELDPDYPDGQVRLGDLYAALGRPAEARERYARARELGVGESVLKGRLRRLDGGEGR